MSIRMTVARLERYLDAVRQFAAPTVVTGHPAPDTDAVISTLMEAWRRYETTGEETLPIVRCDRLPTEVSALCGALAARLPLADTPALTDASLPVVLTDAHTDPALAGRVRAVVDHHPPAPHVRLTGIDADIQRVGATATIVAQRFRRQQLLPDDTVARMLLGAIWMDTDGLSPHKATDADITASEWLTGYTAASPAALYAELRQALLSERDVETLYRRDRRLYNGIDGEPLVAFAIMKVWQDAMPDRAAVRRLLAEDVAACGVRVAVAKIILYARDGQREEHYIAAGAAAPTLLARVCAASGKHAVALAADEVYLPPTCAQRGRKWYAQRFADWF